SAYLTFYNVDCNHFKIVYEPSYITNKSFLRMNGEEIGNNSSCYNATALNLSAECSELNCTGNNLTFRISSLSSVAVLGCFNSTDTDGDGYCDSEDCNATNPNTWRIIEGLYTDNNQDGNVVEDQGSPISACVGVDFWYNGYHYYNGSSLLEEPTSCFLCESYGSEGGTSSGPEFSSAGIIVTIIAVLVVSYILKTKKKK
ncbi:thrombospondin type 3 repeat-containing protein, partial [Candidatus Woesearchaeota archaeon]|nr:thrombospondin type 3 repeat-containing protein [Candidatus Woesearchaeota archaeon]